MSTYIIEFAVFTEDNTLLDRGKIKVKNRPDEATAKADFKEYLARKHPTYHRLSIFSVDGPKDFVPNSLGNPFESLFNNIFTNHKSSEKK